MLLPLESSISAGDLMVVVFEGEYDLADKALLRRALEAVTTVDELVLDFTAVTYIDSTALCELILFSRARTAEGRERATLVFHEPNMQRLLEISSVSPLFAMLDTLDEAVPHDKRAIVRYAASYADGSAP